MFYEDIPHNYRFGRVFDDKIDKHMPTALKPLVDFLVSECGMEIEGIYLENYKAPDTVVVMKGTLPIEILKTRFPEGSGLRYGFSTIGHDETFCTLEGS